MYYKWPKNDFRPYARTQIKTFFASMIERLSKTCLFKKKDNFPEFI